jgi:peptide deformylase
MRLVQLLFSKITFSQDRTHEITHRFHNFAKKKIEMILPIVAYGDPVLKKEAEEIDKDYPKLKELVADMFETMYEASGVGLAAPQVGRSIRLFIVDGSPFAETDDDEEEDPKAAGMEGFIKVFINPVIEEESGEKWGFAEGCLSIPKIREEVFRHEKIKISYYDLNWEFHEEEFDGYKARIIQHEYDHIEGVLFTDHLSVLKKRLIGKRLTNISQGIVNVSYKMKFPNIKKGR